MLNQIDLVILVVAGALGIFGASVTLSNRAYPLSWIVFTIWAALKLTHLL